MGHVTNGMNEVMTVEIFKPVLIWVMRVGATVEVHRRRIFLTLLVAGVLRMFSTCTTASSEGTYTVSFLVKHEGGDGVTGVSTVTGLTVNSDGGTAPAVLILGAGNGAGRRRHSSDG